MNIEELSGLTLAELAAGYRNGSLDPVEVVQTTLKQIDAVNPLINAVYGVEAEGVVQEAYASRSRHRTGKAIGLIDGVPVTIKDSVHAVGMTWHHGSSAHGSGIVGTKDAPPVERLKAGGALIIAKCTMPDFGLSGSGVSSFHGMVRNPWGLTWNTGGSSAGAGASIASGIGMMSVGSDIAGSVRLPASHCGLAALKPTQGMIAHTPPSDVRSAGPITRYAADLEAWLVELGGAHPDDRFSVPVVAPPASSSPGSLVLAALDDFGFGPEVEPAVRQVFGRACEAMATIVGQMRKPRATYDFDAYLPIDDSLKLRGWREYAAIPVEQRERTPAQLRRWFAEAGDWSGQRIAQMERDLARGVIQTNALFAGVDFLVTPVMPVVNFPAEQLGPDPTMPLRHTTFTAPFNQSGHPAVSLCAGFDARGLPVGVQIVGRRFDDVRLVRLAAELEAVLWPAGQPRPQWPTVPRPARASHE